MSTWEIPSPQIKVYISLSKGEFNSTGLLLKSALMRGFNSAWVQLYFNKQTNWIRPAPRASGLRPQLDSVVFPPHTRSVKKNKKSLPFTFSTFHLPLHFQLSTFNSPISTLNSPLDILHSPLYALHFLLSFPLSTLHFPFSTLHSPLSTLHFPLSTFHSTLPTNVWVVIQLHY